MSTYIYGLKCPLRRKIMYIGKSTKPEKRFSQHLGGAARGEYTHKTAIWLNELRKRGLTPELVILEEVPGLTTWQAAEKAWILLARKKGWPLTNSTSGGQGLDYIDPADDAAYRKKLSDVMTELWNRPERREEARQRSLNAWADPDVKKARIATTVEVQNRPEHKAKLAISKREMFSRPEVKAAKSAATARLWQTEEYRSTITAARNEPQFVAEQAERLRQRWADPAAREKMMARWTPELRAKQAALVTSEERKAKIKEARTPESRASQAATLRATWARRKAAAD